MPYKNSEDKLKNTRKYWREHPEEYEQHKINCSNNRRLAGFRKYALNARHSLTVENITCMIGVIPHKEEIPFNRILEVMDNAKKGNTPLAVYYKDKWLPVVKREDYILQ